MLKKENENNLGLPSHIKVSPLIYRGYNLSRYLINFYAYKKRNINSHELKERFKEFIKKVLWQCSFLGTFSIARHRHECNDYFRSNIDIRYLFVINYPPKHRAFPVLNNIILKVTDKDEVLVVTDSRKVYEYYTSLEFACTLIKINGLCFDRDLWRKNSFEPSALFILSKVKKYIEVADEFLQDVQPKILLTVCDLHTHERVFAETARLKDIITITHQHGQMAPTNHTFDYTISEHLVVWGEKTKNSFDHRIEASNIKVLGTDIYNKLLKGNILGNKDSITLALNPRSDEINKFLIDAVVSELSKLDKSFQKNYNFILKLHPAMEFDYWSHFLLGNLKQKDFRMNYEIAQYDNDIILKRSKILILLSSSIAIEAFICESSVVAIDIPSLYKNPFVYFDNLPESKVLIDDLSKEIAIRLCDEDYNNKILDKQAISLKGFISCFDSSEKELEWLDDLISMRANK